VDWARLRREAVARAAGAQTTADTYPAIRYALERAGGPHSAFRDPEQVRVYAQFGEESYRRLGIQFLAGPALEIVGLVSGGPGEDSGLRAGDLLEAVNGRPIPSTAEVQAVSFGGEAVTLTFRRPGQPERLSVSVRPAVIPNGAAVPVPKPEARRLE